MHAVYSSPEHLQSASVQRAAWKSRHQCIAFVQVLVAVPPLRPERPQARTSAQCKLFRFCGLTHLTHTCLLHAATSYFLADCQYFSPILLSDPCMADAEEQVTSAEAMRNLLSSARVADMLVEYILGLGFEDIADFAYAYADASDLSKLLDGVPPETWTSMGVTDPEHSIPAARIRRAFVMAKASASQESLPTASVSHTGQVLPGPQASPAIAWAEHLPPKLSPEVVQDLVDKFQKNYPGELLGPDSMPSIRLLSMVYDMTKSKHFKWIPWQLRLSARQYQEAMEARSDKVARTEAQLLTHAFFDETPEVSVEGRALTASWLHRTQQVFRNALALCQAAHLLNAKALDQQIASMCLAQPDPALSLRTVTTSKLLHADRKIWGTIVDLLHRKWSMDDAFHELTHGRMELMLRPKISQSLPCTASS